MVSASLVIAVLGTFVWWSWSWSCTGLAQQRSQRGRNMSHVRADQIPPTPCRNRSLTHPGKKQLNDSRLAS